jgi:hypothetical protein
MDHFVSLPVDALEISAHHQDTSIFHLWSGMFYGLALRFIRT